MLIRLKNAGTAGHAVTTVPLSALKTNIADLLKREGYIKSITKKGKKVKKTLELELVYKAKTPRITDVARISKPSRRVYHGVGDIKAVRQGYGLAVYSTSRGLMTDKEARTAQVGGEILFKIW